MNEVVPPPMRAVDTHPIPVPVKRGRDLLSLAATVVGAGIVSMTVAMVAGYLMGGAL